MKTAIITGATGSIGRAIAWQIASMDYKVVITAKDEHKAQQVLKQIIDISGNKDVSYEMVDLSRKSSIKEFRKRWKGPLHLLINNAGATPRKRELTPEGIEMQWATNVLGYFWMIEEFKDLLIENSPCRIVNVASYWAGDLDFKDLEFESRHYNNDTAYRQSKQADRMLSIAFANQLRDKGVTVNACHPGDVKSTLSNNVGYGGHESPDQGADTPVWVATSEKLEGITGKYFEHRRESVCRFGQDKEAVERLLGVCQGYWSLVAGH